MEKGYLYVEYKTKSNQRSTTKQNAQKQAQYRQQSGGYRREGDGVKGSPMGTRDQTYTPLFLKTTCTDHCCPNTLNCKKQLLSAFCKVVQIFLSITKCCCLYTETF